MYIAIKEEIKTEVDSDSCDESINNTFIDTNNYLQTNLHFVHCACETETKILPNECSSWYVVHWYPLSTIH